MNKDTGHIKCSTAYKAYMQSCNTIQELKHELDCAEYTNKLLCAQYREASVKDLLVTVQRQLKVGKMCSDIDKVISHCIDRLSGENDGVEIDEASLQFYDYRLLVSPEEDNDGLF